MRAKTLIAAALSGVIVALPVGPARAQAVPAEIVSQRDAAFLSQAAQAAAAQVLLARLAAERAESPEALALAARIERAWMARGQRLSDIAFARGLVAPTSPDPRGRGAVLRLSALPAEAAFDREWALQLIAAANAAITLFETLDDAADGGRWPELAAFARAALPAIAEEKAAAQALELQLR